MSRFPYDMVSNANIAGGHFRNGFLIWGDSLQPYVKSLQIFRCPSNTKTNSPVVSGLPPLDAVLQMSYGVATKLATPYTEYAFGLSGTNPPGFYGFPTKLSSFNDVTQTFLIGEIQSAVAAQNGFFVNPIGTTYCTTNKVCPGNNHFDGGNWLFADGHVKFLKLSQSGAKIKGVTDYYWLRTKPE